MKRLTLLLCLLLPAAAHAQSLDDQIALVRQAMDTDREALITLNVHFTSAESQAFWPLYREYRRAMKAHGDLRLQLIRDFAASYEGMKDEQATAFLERSLNIQQDRVDTRRQYADRFLEVLPGKKAARVMQMEWKMDTAIDMKLASEIPIVR